jgi:hypothetical protein
MPAKIAFSLPGFGMENIYSVCSHTRILYLSGNETYEGTGIDERPGSALV